LVRRIQCPKSTNGVSIAAVTEQGDILLSQPSAWGTTRSFIQHARLDVLEDIHRRRLLYGGKPLSLKRRDVIIVDDCIATGASVLAAIHAVKKESPRRIIVAAPFCSAEARHRLKGKCDELIVLHYPQTFTACAQFYINFPTVNDSEVIECCQRQRERSLMRSQKSPRRVQSGQSNSNTDLQGDLSLGASVMETRTRRHSRASSSSLTSSSCEEDVERKEEDLSGEELDRYFRVHHAQSWSALGSDEEERTCDEPEEKIPYSAHPTAATNVLVTHLIEMDLSGPTPDVDCEKHSEKTELTGLTRLTTPLFATKKGSLT